MKEGHHVRKAAKVPAGGAGPTLTPQLPEEGKSLDPTDPDERARKTVLGSRLDAAFLPSRSHFSSAQFLPGCNGGRY
jgi:hypothetical protein